MSNWDELSLRDKAEFIKVGVRNGLTSISDIKEQYNKFDEGGEKDVTNNLNLLDKALLGISSTIMELGRSGNIRFKTKGSRGAAQDTYLLPRNLQKKVFLDAGYIEGNPGDYGLVKKAVGNRNIPVYQTAPDAVSREDLIVLGNPKQSEQCYYPTNNALYHAGSYPSALYMDTNYNIYRKSWDLNDYGNTTGTAGTTYGNKQWKANLIDKIGSPVVVTTGFQPVMDNIHGGEQINLIDLFNRKDPHAMKYIEQQKLYPLYEDIPIYYNNEPVLKYDGSPMTYTDVTMFSNAPEIIVTPKGNYVYNSYDNVVNKLGGGGGLSKYGLVYDPKIKGWRNKSGNIEGGGFYRTLTNGRKVHFNTDGTVTHLDNYALQDFIRRIKQEENSKDNKKGGWNEEKQVWEPHSSYEGGEKTIAYGIKLFDADKTSPINKKYIDLANKQGYLTDEQANNAVVELGLSYMTQAKKVYDKKFQSGSWDKLSDKSKSILTDFQYNPGLSKFPSFMKAFNEGNIDNAYKEYKRYSGKNPLISRNKAIELDLDSIKNKFYTMHN